MNKLELIVYNVGHGLTIALIERPNNYVTLIDLGASTGFTPLKDLSLKRQLRPDLLYVTHPHADHITDVETALEERFKPLGINYQEYDWEDVKKREKPELAYKIDKFKELRNKVLYRDYGGEADLAPWRFTPNDAKQRFGDGAYVNNSSYFIIYSWQDFKIAIGGDMETAAIESLLGQSNFQRVAKHTDILVASHHGHKSGFATSWVEKIGKPHVNLISVQERDPHVDSRYSSPDFAQGVTFSGKQRYTITTRADGSIHVTMWHADGQPKWKFEPL